MLKYKLLIGSKQEVESDQDFYKQLCECEENIKHDILSVRYEQRTYENIKSRLANHQNLGAHEIKEIRKMIALHDKRITSMEHREILRGKIETECKVRELKEKIELNKEKEFVDKKNAEVMNFLMKRKNEEAQLIEQIDSAVKERVELQKLLTQQADEKKSLQISIKEHTSALDYATKMLDRYRRFNEELKLMTRVRSEETSFAEKLKENERLEKRVWELNQELNERNELLKDLNENLRVFYMLFIKYS